MALPDQQRTERYRQKLRSAGLRPIQVWVPDITRPGFSRQLRSQIALLHGQQEERETLDFIEAVEYEEHSD